MNWNWTPHDTIWACIVAIMWVLVFVTKRNNYLYGVWDGAFNRSLPHVEALLKKHSYR